MKSDAPVVARILVSEQVGKLLMLRSAVPPLFQKVARNRSDRVILDFTDVDFMSRSFAHEYLSEKATSRRAIEERHVPENVRKMLDLVEAQLASARAKERSRSSIKGGAGRNVLRATPKQLELPALQSPRGRSVA